MAAEDGGSSDCRSVHPAPDRQMSKRRFHGGRSCYANGRRIATRRANQPDLIQYLPALRSGSLVREEDQTGMSGGGVPDEVCCRFRGELPQHWPAIREQLLNGTYELIMAAAFGLWRA